MRFPFIIGLAAVAAACGNAPQTQDLAAFEPQTVSEASDPSVIERLKADVAYLASDELEGREAGEPGYDLAADYVAERFGELGLRPVGDDDSYFQNVTFRAFKSNLYGGAMVSMTGGDEVEWEANTDFLGASTHITATLDDVPVVFAGYGFVSDKYGRDDYADIDVDGKVVALIWGAPKFLPSEELAHYRSVQNRMASEQGAVGVIRLLLPSFEEERRTFQSFAASAARAATLRWVNAEGDAHSNAPNIIGGLIMGQIGATKLFASIGQDWQEVAATAEIDEGLMEAFDTGLRVSMRFDNSVLDFESPNVVGLLPGTDPSLTDELVVVTAHLDHVGVSGVGDDRIHNGAMDNAVGVASLLEAATVLAADPPARPVLFAAVTAEEKGLLGSDYLARHNPVADTRYAANINLDMPILTYAFEDLIGFGAERSTLGPVVAEATGALGVQLTPDPVPEQGLFTRSDHYSFVKQGVPSLFLFVGFGGRGAEEFPAFLATHYHKPSDELDLVMFDQLERFAKLNTGIIANVADMDEAPTWFAGDFFGTAFGGPMADE
ncbi:MAG: M28 family peptidase [Pseudomonadota bacterium]